MLSIYEAKEASEVIQTEVPLYGSSRLGIWRANRNATNCGEQPGEVTAQYTGAKRYELSDHLGNVLALISDKKLEHNWTGGTTVDQWLPDLVEARDYYAFGGDIVGRSYNSTGQAGRYGFNGKEDDADISEGGQDYGMRIYDKRSGRFFSVDPLTREYPWYTPYQFASNIPVSGIDLDGAEYRYFMVNLKEENGRTKVQSLTAWRVEYQVEITMETLVGPRKIKWPRFTEAFVVNVGFYNYKFSSYSQMANAVSVLDNPAIMALSDKCHCLPNTDLSQTVEAEEEAGRFLQNVGNAASAGLSLGNGLKNIRGIRLPQGMGKSLFKNISQIIRKEVGTVSDDIVIQGSRAAGNAKTTSDLDIAIKVSSADFDKLIVKAFGNPNVGSAKFKTMQRAIETGKIQSGEAGFRSLRKELEKMLGVDVDISIIKVGGKFDNGTQIPIR